MPFLLNLFLLLAELWLLAGIALGLHRLSPRLGLAPLLVFSGGLVAIIQFQSAGWIAISLGELQIRLDSDILLPTLLLSLLVIYIVNGTSQARFSLAGIILVTLLVALLESLLQLHLNLAGSLSQSPSAQAYNPGVLAGSIIILMIDASILVIVYQFLSDTQKRFPSPLAAGAALTAAMACDALLLSLLTSLAGLEPGSNLLNHAVGKIAAGLLLWPLLSWYLQHNVSQLPGTAAKEPRPALDLFTMTEPAEARRWQYVRKEADSQREFAEALTQATFTLNSSLDLDEVLDQMLGQIIRVASCQSVNIMLTNEHEAYVVRRTGYEHFPEHMRKLGDFHLPLNFPTLQHMIATREPILIGDTQRDSRWSPLLGTEWIRSHAAAPMMIEDQIIGFLNIDSDRPDDFNEETIRRLKAFAAHAALAIYNARLYEDSRYQNEELTNLVEAAAAVSSSLEINEVLRVIAQQMVRLLRADLCSVSSFDATSGTVKLLAAYPAEPEALQGEWSQPLPAGEMPVIEQILAKLEPVQVDINDPLLNAKERRYMLEGRAHHLLILPMVVQDQVIGLIALVVMDAERVFTRREMALAQTLAFQAATAFQNARLYQRTQQHAGELEERVRERTSELQAAKERIEGILASVPDAVFVLDQAGKLVQANQAGESLLAAATQQNLCLFAIDHLADLGARSVPSEKTIIEVQGRAYQPLASQLSLDEQPAGQVLVFRDVTRFQELDKMKTQFVSDVSHELRTPLTNMTIYLGLLSSTEEPEKRNPYLLTLRRETERLTHLIEDLLTISRLEAGRVDLFVKPIDVNRLVSELVADRSYMASTKGILLECAPAAELPKAMADKRLLNQAISNLLTNAINYTPADGSVRLETGLSDQAGAQWVTIRVIDSGFGIPEEEQAHIFERFYRGTASQQAKAPGTGLGLPISKEILERMEGTITLESQVGKGSSFTVWLRPCYNP